MASREAQAKHTVVMQVLTAIVEGSPPALAGIAKDPGLARMVARLPFFVRKSPAASANNPVAMKFGGEALKLIFEEAAKKHTDGDCTRKDVEQLIVFRHFLPPEIRDDVNAFVKSVLHGAPAQLADKSAKNTSKKLANKETAVAEAMSLFGK